MGTPEDFRALNTTRVEGTKSVFIELLPGQSSPPGMDVDIIIVQFPDGSQSRYMLPGGDPPQNPATIASSYAVGSGGKVSEGPPIYREIVRGRFPGAPYNSSFGFSTPVARPINFGKGSRVFPWGGKVAGGMGSETGDLNQDIERAKRRSKKGSKPRKSPK